MPIQIRFKVFYRLDYCQEFSSGCTVVFLRPRQGPIIVSYYHLGTILNLRQHSLDQGTPRSAPLLKNPSGGQMLAAQPVSTAITSPLLSAGLVTVQFLRSSVCTDDSTLPVPGMHAIQGGQQGQPSLSRPVNSRGRWRPHPN